MSLELVISKIQDIVLGVDGVRTVMEQPTEQIATWPAIVCYPLEWNAELLTAGVVTTGGEQIIVMDMLWPRGRDLPRLVAEALPFGDSIPATLFADNDLGNTVHATTKITGTLGVPRLGPYAGENVFGWTWRIEVMA